MGNDKDLSLINPKNGHLSFKLFYFDDSRHFDSFQRNEFYTLLWITKGSGRIKANFSEHNFQPNALFAFSPYQPFMFSSENLQGAAIYFHHDFFCIHQHQKEVSCNGVLFNNIYEPPFVSMDTATSATLDTLIEQIKTEIQNVALAQYELLISYLKILLITASRKKAEQKPMVDKGVKEPREPAVLQDLKDIIEKDFKTNHAPSHYADALNLSPKALSKIAKVYLNKTLGDLISERIIIEAKRELYVTRKSVKEIAYELGYQDEYYFSRFFKANAEVSPQTYRSKVGFERGMQMN